MPCDKCDIEQKYRSGIYMMIPGEPIVVTKSGYAQPVASIRECTCGQKVIDLKLAY